MKIKEKNIQIAMVIITVMMTILRFLLNEKGRVNPDSIRFMRFAHVFPTIDNTTTPLGYPVAVKLFTFLGFDEFWGSKALGIAALLYIVCFCWIKNFYRRGAIMLSALFSFVSLYAYTMSEALFLPFVFLFLYTASQIITGKLGGRKAVFYLSVSLITLYNIRYSALFFMAGTGLYGLLSLRKKYGPVFILSGVIGLVFIAAYKFLFIDYFNQDYVKTFLEVGLHPTSQLLREFFQGLTTSFNPFIHIADPGGGQINFAIYGIGVLNILLLIYLLVKERLTETELFFVVAGSTGILCSYFIQYFYSVNPMDYRIIGPFLVPLWLIYFHRLFKIFGIKTYVISILSILTGMTFTWLSKGNYLENRKAVSGFLKSEKLDKVPLKFYVTKKEEDLNKMKTAELVSTVNADVTFTYKPKDTLQKTTLTWYKVLQKIKIDKNKYQ
ncbi:MAG: hypothetical protein LBE92_08505 [Chryseobacterium sp.]|jgi:hypothetical protein|uniref:hypothetical protein n=1 Tax=Chryseobacterium sp. TaxID=1871047 RepID=UPI0028177C77|nr:hypothetical protein [Chryseobacterium sp.]MDR2236151.1 hypothetical protein [Chryseobacterium sp.]